MLRRAHVVAMDRYEAELTLERLVFCSPTGELGGVLVTLRVDGGGLAPVGEHRCLESPGTSRVRVPVNEVLALFPEGVTRGFAHVDLTFINDDVPDTVDEEGVPVQLSGTVTYTFYVTDADAAGARPRITQILPAQTGPGYSEDLRDEHADAYLGPTGLAAPNRVMPHAFFRFSTDLAATDLATYGLVVRPDGGISDVGQGFVPRTTRGGVPASPFQAIESRTELGLIPGVRYDIRLVGERGLTSPELGITQDVTGAILEPRVDPLLPTDHRLRSADARFVLDVHPIRVESPGGAQTIGRRDIGLSPDAPSGDDPPFGTLDVQFIAPPGALPLGSFITTELFTSTGAFFASRRSGLPAVESTLPIEQAGASWAMEHRTSTVDVPTAPAEQSLRVRVVASLPPSSGSVPPVDEQFFTLDLMPPPVATTLCEPGQLTGGCTLIEETDRTDCDLARVCVPTPEGSDVERVEVTYCGVTRELVVEPGSEPGYSCTEGPISFDGGTGRPGDVVFRTVDDAGNYSVPSDETRPPCFESPTRNAVGAPSNALVARDPAGRPLRVRSETRQQGLALIVERWNGSAWNEAVFAYPQGQLYRGRLGRAVSSTGEVVFCATRRPLTSDDPGGPTLRGDLRGGGYLDVGVIDASGASVEHALDVRALGCSMARLPSFTTGEDRFVVTYGRIIERASTADLPTGIGMAVCTLEDGRLGCEEVEDGRIAALPALGLEPDVAVTPDGSIHLVGRGFVLGSAFVPRFFEHGLYYLRVPPSPSAPLALTRVVAGDTATCQHRPLSFGPRGFLNVNMEGASTPRLVVQGNSVAVVAWHYAANARLFGRGLRDNSRSDSTTTLSLWELRAASVGPQRVLAVRERSTGPRFGTFSNGFSYSDPPVQPEGCRSPSPSMPAHFDAISHNGGADIFAPFDSLPSDGNGIRNTTLFYPSYRDPQSGVTFPDLEVLLPPRTSAVNEYDGVSALRRISLDPTWRLTTPLLTVSDTDVGEAVGLSAWRDERGQTSLSYYRDNRGSPANYGLTYAEERAGQFLSQRDESTGDCAATLYTRQTLNQEQLALRPRRDLDFLGNGPGSGAAYTNVRMGGAMEVAYSNLSAQLSCQLNNYAEDLLARDGIPPSSMDDVRFNHAVRHPVISSYLSWLSGFDPDVGRPATLLSLRFPAGTTFTARALTFVDASTGAGGRTIRLSAGTRGPDELVAAINDAIGDATPTRPRAAVFRIGPAPLPRLADTRPFRIVLLSWPVCSSPTGCVGAALVVRASTLATALGVPVGATARSPRGLDLSDGDIHDRTRPSVRHTPCTPGDGGTCQLPEDFLPLPRTAAGVNPDEQTILWQMFSGLELAMGRPPLRRQSGVCVPAHQTDTSGDVCAPTTTAGYRSHTATDYRPFTVPPVSGVCPAGSQANDARTGCFTCGLSRSTGDDSTAPAIPMGTPRLCNTDSDCPTDPADRRILLCTELSVPFAGVPAFQGFCASPAECTESGSPACFPRTLGDIDGDRVFEVVRGANTWGANSFEPAIENVACTLTGCNACLGDVVNGVCGSDAECPTDHRCLLSGTASASALRSPACIVRPFASDHRLRGAVQSLEGAEDPGATQLATEFSPVLLSIQEQLLASLGTLNLPTRFYSAEGGARVLVSSLDARLRGATLRLEQHPTFPVDPTGTEPLGPGEVVLTLIFDGGIRVSGEVAIGDLRDSLTVTARLRAMEVRFVPSVDSSGQLQLRFRRVELLSAARVAGDARDVALGDEDVDVDVGGESGFLLDLLSPAGVVGVFFVAPLMGLEGPMGTFLSQFPGPAAAIGFLAIGDPTDGLTDRVGSNLSGLRVDGLGAVLARVIQQVREEPLIAALFGVDRVAGSLQGSLGAGAGSGMENAWVWPSGRVAPEPGVLETVHRGRLTDLGALLRPASANEPQCGGIDRCGCIDEDFGQVEPDPNCLESVAPNDTTCAADASLACPSAPSCQPGL